MNSGMIAAPGETVNVKLPLPPVIGYAWPRNFVNGMAEQLREVAQRLVDDHLAKELGCEWTPSGTSPQKIALVTNPSPATTAQGIGPSAKCSSSSGMHGYPKSVFEFYKESGKTAMSDNTKSILLDQGGRWNFKVTKTCLDDVERFTVTLGDLNYGRGIEIAGMVTWVEASAAMNKFRDEFDEAFEALVQISTLTPVGAHEES